MSEKAAERRELEAIPLFSCAADFVQQGLYGEAKKTALEGIAVLDAAAKEISYPHPDGGVC